MGDSVEDEARHIDKKPRLDSPTRRSPDTPFGLRRSPDAPFGLRGAPSGSKSSGASLLGALSSVIHSAKVDKKKTRYKNKSAVEPYSKEDIVRREVISLLGQEAVDKAVEEGTDWKAPFQQQEEVELVVSCLSAHGDSLSIAPAPHSPWVVITPFALPGETIKAKIYRHSYLCSYADLVEVVKPNPELRDDSRVKCKYFGTCSGCQYQMLTYETQLDLKRDIIVKAYHYYSDLPPSSVPEVLPTIGSPLQYEYRTKLTPHFEMPKKAKRGLVEPTNGAKPDWFSVGFNKIGTRFTMDIEECPIATPTINKALGPIREGIFKKLHTYKRGVSLLLRDSLDTQASSSFDGAAAVTDADEPEKHICITDHNATVRERVGDTVFEYSANSFFQNNNSVLVPLTSYVRDSIFPADASSEAPRATHLVDAYCGSGLFALTLAPAFDTVRGIELSRESIAAAKDNAKLNHCAEKCQFLEGDAADIFATVEDFPREHTALIIDPPRKGADENFIDQLLQFGCQTVVYVSCNVHTQARDIGMILRKSEADKDILGWKYVVESLRGFDLFPQTAHVESVAVLRRVRDA